jgi:hypothetical protein
LQRNGTLKRKADIRNKYNEINPKSKTKVPEVKIQAYTKIAYTAPTAISPLYLSLADNFTDTFLGPEAGFP